MNDLPTGVTRSRHASPRITLANCDAIRFSFEPDGLSGIIVWRDKPARLRPVEQGKRISELRPGDRVLVEGVEETLRVVELYR